jgi:hypothetical protein
MSSNDNEFSHLHELGNSQYEVAAGESDIRSWVVKNENGNILGEVQDLIFDSQLRRVVFIVLDLDRNELNLKERKVLIPIEYADVNEAYKNVIVKGLMPNEVATLPTYEKGKITRNSLDLTMSTFISSINTNVAGQPDTSSARTDSANHFSAAPAAGQAGTSNYVAGTPATQETFRQDTGTVAADTNRENVQDLRGRAGETFYTVIGAFDSPRQTQAAIEYLLNHGFMKDEITVSTRQPEVVHEHHNRDEGGIKHFFKTLFRDDEEVRRYSDAAGHGSVVTLDVSSPQKAEEAARILDQHGSLDMTAAEHVTDSTGRQKGFSRIFERRTSR